MFHEQEVPIDIGHNVHGGNRWHSGIVGPLLRLTLNDPRDMIVKGIQIWSYRRLHVRGHMIWTFLSQPVLGCLVSVRRNRVLLERVEPP